MYTESGASPRHVGGFTHSAGGSAVYRVTNTRKEHWWKGTVGVYSISVPTRQTDWEETEGLARTYAASLAQGEVQ